MRCWGIGIKKVLVVRFLKCLKSILRPPVKIFSGYRTASTWTIRPVFKVTTLNANSALHLICGTSTLNTTNF